MRRIISLCLALWLGGGIFFAGGATQAQNAPPNLPFAPQPTARPRLLITEAYLDGVLLPRWHGASATAARYRAYVESRQPEADLAQYPEQVTRSLALAYLLTGERAYADRALLGLLRMVDSLQSHPSLTTNSAWDELFLERAAEVAIAYDWLYPALSNADRQGLENILTRTLAVLNDPVKGQGRAYQLALGSDGYLFAAFDHWGARLIWALTATSIALLGDNPNAPSSLAYARELFTEWMLPALDDLSGGAWAEGPTYGYQSAWALTQTATSFWTTFGEDYFTASRWWYDRLAYDMFLPYPTIQRVANAPDGMPFWGYPSIIGDSERYSDAALLGRATDALLSTVFSGSDQAAWMNWFLAQAPPNQASPVLEGAFAVHEFLWRDPDAEGFPPPWLLLITARSGHAFLRSSWDLNDPNALYISFNAGGRYAEHQFFDAGGLTLWFRDADLLLRSGVYSGVGGSEHDANYYGRSIAANTILICDLNENFSAVRPNAERFVWLNDCGQRSMTPLPPTAINSFFRGENAATYDTGQILRFVQRAGISYIRADLTNAYNSPRYTSADNRPKVNEVMRELVYLRPFTLLIHDRVIPIDDFKPLLNFHTEREPILQGDWWTLSNPDSGTTLYLNSVAPNTLQDIFTGYEVAGEDVSLAFGQPTQNTYESEPYGLQRLQIMPLEQAEIYGFLTLITLRDTPRRAPPITTYIEGDNLYGLAFQDWQVMFALNIGNVTAASFDITPDVVNLWLTGLQPSANYRLTWSNNQRTDVSADASGALYAAVEAGGTVRLARR